MGRGTGSTGTGTGPDGVSGRRARAAAEVTLGILAGGRATRLGGLDKAWIVREGVSQVLRWQRRFAGAVAALLISANRDLPRYAAAGLEPVADRIAGDAGPIAGLEALLARCRTPWLLTIPVDLVDVGDELLPALDAARGSNGAYAVDEDGRQPLVALWNVAAARDAVAQALREGETAVHALQARLGMVPVGFSGRFGNLNTPEDLAAAGLVFKAPS